MSIEKIKERIKKIEDSNYSLNEYVTNLEPAQLNAFSKQMNLDKGNDAIRSKTSKGLKNTLNVGGNAMAGGIRGLNIAKSGFSGVNKVYIGNLIALPAKDEPVIFKIYNLLRTYGVLTSDIDSNNQPKHGGYSERGNMLFSEKTHELQFNYDDSDLTTLIGLQINFKKNKYKQRDIDAVVKEIDYNGASYNVKAYNFNMHSSVLMLKF